MQRRSFLKQSAFLAGSAAIHGGSGLVLAQSCREGRLPGAQLFTVRNALDEDVVNTLARLSAAGVREVEIFGLTSADTVFGMALPEFRQQLDAHGLSAFCAHMDTADMDVAGISRAAHALGLQTVILPIGPDFIQVSGQGVRIQGPGTLMDVRALGDLMTSLGQSFAGFDLNFAYHNHHVEFFAVEGQIPFDYLMAYTDPEVVKVELDVGWLALANVNYLDYLDRYGPRIVSVHLKDFDGTRPDDMGDFLGAASHLVPPGSGVMDFSAVLERMDAYDIRHGFVEIDLPQQPFAAIESGLNHIGSFHSC